MPNYTKLFNIIVTSTIWTEDDKTRIVWITMLAIADKNGEVMASIPGLARLAGVGVTDTQLAIDKFLSPDKYSRTPDNEGRRIGEIDGGWEILNHAKYRRMASLADKRESTAKRQRRFRERNATVTPSVTSNAPVTLETDKAEAEAEEDKNTPRAPLPKSTPPETEHNQPKEARAHMLGIAEKIQSLRPAWKLPLTYAEMQALMQCGATADAINDDDWQAIGDYLRARLPQGMPGWQPKSRGKFIESLPDVYGYAVEWRKKNGGEQNNKPRTGGWK